MSEFLTIFNKETSPVNEIPVEDRAIDFPYPLDHFQKEGIYRIYKKENILITAHTGSGKTVLAIYAIAECFRLNKKVIYTSPTKSLSNQKYAEFVDKFGGKEKIGIMTGDIKMNPDAPCLIMTTEILRNILYRDAVQKKDDPSIVQPTSSMMTSLKVEDIGAVVFDEVHYINDPERGKVWEEVFILLPPNVTLVLLSATIDKPEEFAGWLGNMKQRPIHLIPTTHRVVPLRHHFYKNGKLLEILMEDGKFKNYDVVKKNYMRQDMNRIMNEVIIYLKEENLLPVLFFTFSRKRCEKLCHSVQGIQLLDHKEQSEVKKIFQHYLHKYKDIYEKIPQYQEIYDLMRRGIAYHHSGLIPILKEIVEIMFGKGLVKVLFATETFAVGVNMPTKTVVFSDLEKFDNKGRRYLRTDEYLQMSGRAGRRGLDKIGTVILLPTMDLPDMNQLKSMMTGKSPRIKSQFIPNYQFVLKTMMNKIREGEDSDFTHMFLEKTLRREEDRKVGVRMIKEMEELEKSMKDIEVKNEFSEEFCKKMEEWIKNKKRLDDHFMMVKGKDRKKLEDEQKKIEESITNFQKKKFIYLDYEDKKNEYQNMKDDMEYNDTVMNEMTEKMTEILVEKGYLKKEGEEIEFREKGITAISIGEADEILMTEMIHGGYLDDLTFEEIVTSLAIFVDEIDKSGDEKHIDDLNVSLKVKRNYKEMVKKVEEWSDIESKRKLYIHSDEYYENCIHLDMLEPTWIWCRGGSMAELYKSTELYAGNFVRGMLRLNQLCDTLVKISISNHKMEIAQKMEGFQEKLIRDFTTITSLYVN